MPLAPPSVLSLLAHHETGHDPHVRPGTHLRWISSPRLNLPIQPVILERANLAQQPTLVTPGPPFWRDIVWFSLTGAPLAPPFNLPSGQQAFGFFERPGTPLVAYLDVVPLAPGGAVGPIYAEVAGHGEYVATAQRSPESSWLPAGGAARVRATGPCRVRRSLWLSRETAEEEAKFHPAGTVDLPTGPTLRYAGLADWLARARNRVLRGAPLRRGLDDDFTAAGPALARAMVPAEDLGRTALLFAGEVEGVFRRLVSDMSAPPSRLIANRNLGDGISTRIPMLAMFFIALSDPSLARFLGFAETDTAALAGLTVYRLRATFTRTEIRDEPGTEHALTPEERSVIPSPPLGPNFELVAHAAVDPLGAFRNLPPVRSAQARHVLWTSGGDQLLRRAELSFRLPSAALAAVSVRRTSAAAGAVVESLNTPGPGGVRLPIVPVRPRGAGESARLISEGEVPAEAQTYQIAARDAFGRWSPWAGAPLAAGTLVPPPKPAPVADYIPAALEPADDSLRCGSVRCRIRIPASQTPGCPRVDAVRVWLERIAEDGAVTAISDQTAGFGGDGYASLLLDGPSLGRGQVGTLRIRARFRAGALESAQEGQTRLIAADPRPPAPLAVSAEVLWATRPDARGVSTIRLEWPTGPAHASYRVYMTSQSALFPFLASLGAGGAAPLRVLRDPAASYDDAALAIAELVAAGVVPPKNAFELLTPAQITAGRERTRYDAQVPGRSRELFLFRVAALGESNVEEPWSNSPALFYVAVPPTVKPQPPRLEVARPGPEQDGVRLLVRAAGAPATRVRILRSANTTAAAAQMSPLVEQAVEAGEPFSYLDSGPTIISPSLRLVPWAQYAYRAQVKANVTGGGPDSPWSDPSQPAIAWFIPPEAPPAPSLVTVVRAGDSVTLTWTCDLPMRTTALGDFRFRVVCAPPGGALREVASLAANASLAPDRESFTFTHAGASRSSRYRVETLDPLGRRTEGALSDAV